MTPLAPCALLIGNWLCAVCLTGTCDLSPRAEAAKQAASPYTITVAKDQPAAMAQHGLTVELVEVRDNRCAAEVQCVWAGYAEVALRVSRPGAAAETVVIGTLTRAPDAAPLRPRYDGYEFGLVRLEPANSMAKPVAQSAYRATLVVSKVQ